jgi:hypothetical protein
MKKTPAERFIEGRGRKPSKGTVRYVEARMKVIGSFPGTPAQRKKMQKAFMDQMLADTAKRGGPLKPSHSSPGSGPRVGKMPARGLGIFGVDVYGRKVKKR